MAARPSISIRGGVRTASLGRCTRGAGRRCGSKDAASGWVQGAGPQCATRRIFLVAPDNWPVSDSPSQGLAAQLAATITRRPDPDTRVRLVESGPRGPRRPGQTAIPTPRPHRARQGGRVRAGVGLRRWRASLPGGHERVDPIGQAAAPAPGLHALRAHVGPTATGRLRVAGIWILSRSPAEISSRRCILASAVAVLHQPDGDR